MLLSSVIWGLLGMEVNKNVKLLCYKALVLLLKEDASCVWATSNKKHITQIELIQRRAYKHISSVIIPIVMMTD